MATPGRPLHWDDSDLHWNDPRLRWGQPFPSITNMSNNRISAVLASTAVTNIMAAIATIRENLPFLIALTLEERHDLAKMGEKRQGAISLGRIFAAQHPEALPGTFDAVEFAKDGTLFDVFAPVVAAIAQLAEDVSDTDLALRNDLMLEFLDLYAFVKAINRNGQYDAFLASVAPIFARGPRTPATPPPGP